MKKIIIITLCAAAVILSGFKLIGCSEPSYTNYFWFAVIAAAVFVGGDAYVKPTNNDKQ